MKEYILVTGGAGYIGSHTAIELIENGYDVVIVDNLVNSSYDAVARIEYIVRKNVPFVNADIGNHDDLLAVFRRYNIKGVIHLAALKAVGESTQIPLDYYYNNVRGTINLLTVMKEAGVKTIVFSSSATVYGDATRFEDMIPIPEHCPTGATNPYGRTKLMIEEILRDVHAADPLWRAAVLRYFNPIGAHPSGLIGEDPLGIPNNLLPFLAQVAVGRREKLMVFGNDYDSHDGTPIRDYIHVVDLARGHVSALAYLRRLDASSGLFREWNLGTGNGSTVFDVFHAFCKAIGRELPYEVTGRRAGDVLNLTANPLRANSELEWHAELSVEDACRDLWKWTTENPYGFSSENYKWSHFSSAKDYESRLHTITFGDFEVVLANYGATIQRVSKGSTEFVQGFDTHEQYKLAENPYFGATIGRYANRIANAKFTLDGEKYALAANEAGITSLHGGNQGFDKKVFLGPVVKQKKKGEPISLEFLLVDEDGSNGFPATLVTQVKYVVAPGSLEVEYTAEIPQESKRDATPVNLTNHSYFRIGGAATINDLHVQSLTNEYLEVDDAKIPTGKTAKFAQALVLGTQLGDTAYDHCFVVDKSDFALDLRQREMRKVFEAKNDEGRIEFWSVEPAYQFYTGDGVQVTGRQPRCGFCIEPSRYIDAVNHKEWAEQVIVRKGEVYGSRSKILFG